MSRRALIVPILVLSFLRGVALAAPADDAREATRRATAAYNLGQFEEAAHEYEGAYKLVMDAALLYNIGQSYRQAGKPEKAIVAYRAYLRTSPANAPHRSQAEVRVKELEGVVSQTRTAQAAPPLGVVAGTPAESAASPSGPPQAAPPDVPSAPPSPSSPAGVTTSLVTEPASPTPSQPPVYTRWWFWAAVGGVAVGAVAAAVLIGREPTNPDCLGVHPCGVVK